ncbi:MAG: tetratricopeptide repeat protein [Chitinophagales bacterium]
MQKIARLGFLAVLAVLLMCAVSDDAFAQKKGKKKKKKKKKGKVVKVEEVKPVEPTIDTSEADALFNQPTYSSEDSTNYSLYREFFKQKAYGDAMPYWRIIYANAPAVRKTPLLNGEVMYTNYLNLEITHAICEKGEAEGRSKKLCKEKELGKFKGWKYKDDKVAQAYMDSINMVYKTRVEHFGQEGYITYLQSKLLAKYQPQEKDSIFSLRSKAIEIEAEDATYDVVYYYFRTLLSQVKAKTITIDQLVDKYDQLAEIIDYNKENNEKYAAKYEKYGDIMESTVEKLTDAQNAAKTAKAEANATDCPTIKKVYGEKYKTNPEDISIVKTLYKKLKKGGCKSDPLFMEVLLKWQTLEPSASRARFIAQTYQKQKNYAQAKSFYETSLDLESDNTKKAKVYMSLAKIEQVANSNNSKAREYARKAASMRAGWGDPYLFIGDLYMRSKSSCSGDGFGGSSVYWVAYDMYAHAKEVDPDVYKKAAEKMSNARKGFPSKETIFMKTGKGPGGRFSVGCWIQQSTTVR